MGLWGLLFLLALPPASGAPLAFVAEPPVLLTSAGQAADMQIVKILLERLNVPMTVKALARPDDLRGAKTLVIAIGGSPNGLAAAGIHADQEAARVQSLLVRAQVLRVKILSLHIGGNARRGELSDRFILAVVPKSGHVIVVNEGNTDGLFTRVTAQSHVSIEAVARLSDIEAALRRVFRVK